MSEQPIARIRFDNGAVIIDDPDAIAVAALIDETNLRRAAESVAPIIRRLTARADELGAGPSDFVILLANVDDPNGRVLANRTMPGHDWDAYRDAGVTPIASGLVGRAWMEDFTADFAPGASEALRAVDRLLVVVITMEKAGVFRAEEFA